jgi:hypothetical protein
MKEFFLYLRHGHEEDGGRWGNRRLTAAPRPETVKDYWVSQYPLQVAGLGGDARRFPDGQDSQAPGAAGGKAAAHS